MKKFLLLAALGSTVLLSNCKIDKAATPSCEVTVAGMAANYKITKVELVGSTGTTDVTTTVLDDCERSGLYVLKADKTLVYTEAGSACSGTGTGDWDVVNGKISINGAGYTVSNLTVNNWNCTTFN